MNRIQFFILLQFVIFALHYEKASAKEFLRFHRINKRAEPEGCPEIGEVKCNDTEKCIDPGLICNGFDDCGDNSDEIDCTEERCKELSALKCENVNRCISQNWICDGVDDCGNNSDEIDCGREIQDIYESCEPEEYKCKFINRCISKEKLCDGQWNCKEGDDENEEECQESITCIGFQCHDGQCLENKQQACNGIVDCFDKSDESNCITTTEDLITNRATAKPVYCKNSNGMFLCDNNECIPFSQSCDGKDDCGDNSDENAIKCNQQAMEDSSMKNPEQRRDAFWPALLSCNSSSNFKNRTPHLIFNFFFTFLLFCYYNLFSFAT